MWLAGSSPVGHAINLLFLKLLTVLRVVIAGDSVVILIGFSLPFSPTQIDNFRRVFFLISISTPAL